MNEILKEGMKSFAKASPYGFFALMMVWLLSRSHNSQLKLMKDTHENAVRVIKESYDSALSIIQESIRG